MSKLQRVEYIRTTDGEIFTDVALAEAHQFSIDNKEVIAAKVDAYLNANKLFGRRRAAAENVATQVVSHLLQWNGEAVEFDHEAAEAQAKADAEKAAADAKAPATDAEPAATVDEDQL